MPKGDETVVSVNPREANLKRKFREHLQSLGFTKSEEGELQAPGNTKDTIRSLHRAQREERISASKSFLSRSGKLMKFFASGKEVDPEKISPVLERVSAGTKYGDLFRLASLSWSVPVSNGFLITHKAQPSSGTGTASAVFSPPPSESAGSWP